jgi:hypothetical protein
MLGMTVSAVFGALAYVSNLAIFIGSPTVFIFEIPTQLLMVTFGALVAIFDWFSARIINCKFDECLRKTI